MDPGLWDRSASRRGPYRVVMMASRTIVTGPGPVAIRRIRPSDSPALRAFYADLSEESRRTRFFGLTSGIGESQATRFCTADHDHREGFVAVVPGEGGAGGPERIVGHVCLEPDGPDAAEVSVAVADDLRHRGIGRHLVDVAIAWARAEGLATLTATMLADNPAIARLLTGLGLATVSRPVGADVVALRILLDTEQSAA